MNKIDCIVYSKNRACQLDLLLRSIKDHFKNVGQIHLLYAYSNDLFKLGYEQLLAKNPELQVTLQKDFHQDTLNIIQNIQTPYFLGLCDDDVFVRETDCSDIVNNLFDIEVNSISLKAGININGNYPERLYSLPKFTETEPFLKWDWRKEDPSYDWGYPSCINSYIFLKDYFLHNIENMPFTCPTELEGHFHLRRAAFRRYMLSFKESTLLNIPTNRIQTLSPNPFGSTYNYTAEFLNQTYLDGYVIVSKSIYNTPMRMGNEERELKFEK